MPGCHCYIPFTCLFISSTLFGMIQMKALQHQLRTVKETSKDNEEINRKLNKFIETQNKVIEYIREINDLVGFICLVEFLSFGLMLIALLFLLSIVSLKNI
jgi:odorant receptor